MLRHKLAAALLACGFVVTAAPIAAKPVAAAPKPAAWVQKSNAAAQPLLKVLADFQPEFASQIGIPGYDSRVSDLRPNVVERANQALAAAKAGLQKQLAAEQDPQVRQDLQIMIDSADQQIEGNTLNAKLLLPYYDVGQTIFQGEFALLQDQVDAKRRPVALARLKCYVGMASGCEPIVKLAEARTEEKLADKALLGPYKGEVEQNLANTQRYVDGIRQLYAKFKIAGAEPALDALAQQLKDYDAWVKATVLPHARTDFRLPPELYAFNLKQVGVDITPEQLMQKAELEFMETQAAMQMIAPEVAKANGIDAHDYRDVIKALKKDQLDRNSVEPYYHEIIGKIEDIIRREHIVTLPQRAMQMRLASEAESAAQPAPHMDPPALVNNKGERGTFVLTMGNPSSNGDKSQAYDDFTHKSAAWTLTAHEGRPGHELQFAAMVERGVSLARSLFAFNSVNVEGWALYAEAEMLPYEPPAGQLFALQARLQRAARAFLDPMLNLGLITRERAHDILVHDVGLSEPMTRQELDRYTFRSPGQATSYFYGYTRLLQLRAETQIALGDKFNRQAFNDFVIGQGLLPPDLLAQAVKSEFIPAQMKQ
ncbi:MAG TPA: DUF885 domain-containing protein [Mizugakiibacter sp.]